MRAWVRARGSVFYRRRHCLIAIAVHRQLQAEHIRGERYNTANCQVDMHLPRYHFPATPALLLVLLKNAKRSHDGDVHGVC